MCIRDSLKTAEDVIKAAVFGADSFGFGTAPMIAMGCKYLRICHLNNCYWCCHTTIKNYKRPLFRGS